MKIELEFNTAEDVSDFVVLLESGAKAIGFQSFAFAYEVIKSTLEQAQKQNGNLSAGTGVSESTSG